MKINASVLMVIVDTLLHSLYFANWDGNYTKEQRENVMRTVETILQNMAVNIEVEEE